MDAEHGPVGGGERFEITGGLRGFERAEAVARAGHGHVDRVVDRELQDHEARRAALVELSRRVEEARTVAERGGDAEALAEPGAKLAEELRPSAGGCDVRGDRHVAPGRSAREHPPELCRK